MTYRCAIKLRQPADCIGEEGEGRDGVPIATQAPRRADNGSCHGCGQPGQNRASTGPCCPRLAVNKVRRSDDYVLSDIVITMTKICSKLAKSPDSRTAGGRRL